MAKLDKLNKQVQEHLEPGEEILYSVQGQYETKRFGQDSLRSGAFFATNKRLVFFAKKLTGFDIEVFPYSSISSIEMSKGLMGHKMSFFASGNKVSMKWIQKGDIKELVSFIREKLGHKEQVHVDDSVSKLERLASMKEKGLITDEEFQSEKKKILEK
jgi:hypothetical protein